MFAKCAKVFASGLLLLGSVLFPLVSCGGGGGGSGGSGGGGVDYDYGITLTPDKSAVAPGGTVNLNVKFDAPVNNAGITWKLACLQSDCGAVSGGIYTAPAKVDAQMKVGITATANDKPASGYYVEIWVTGSVKVTISPDWPVTLGINATQQFTATVNSPDTAIIWKVNDIVGGNSTVGTISISGLYTAPAQVPDPAIVTIVAVAHADQTISASKQVTITPPPQITVLISPVNQNVGINSTLQFTATVQNTSDTAVQWKVNGVVGGNSTVGTISTSGLYTAPAAIPTPATVTVTAVSHADSTKSASTSVTIFNLHTSLLNGSYAFQISGPDANGKMSAAIGTFIADGKGSITGMMDTNGVAASAAQIALAFTGTYIIGEENVGRMILNLTPALTLSFTIDSAGTNAKLIEWDTRGTRYAGTFQKQTNADLTLNHFTGDYAFSGYGSTMGGQRIVAIGRFHSVGGGSITEAMIDVKEQGDAPISLSSLTGTVSMSHNTYGRGDFTLSESSSTVAHFSYYMTNAGDLFFLTTDAVPSDNPLLIGRILSQTGAPFTNASLDGPSVVWLAGNGANSSTNSFLVVGQWVASGGTLSGTQDFISDGIVTQNQPLSATYAIAASGRGTLAASTLSANVFYMVAKNKAFVMQTSALEELLGMAEPQQTTTFTNAQFSGTYRIGPISMTKPGGAISQGILVANGAGTFYGGEDILDQSNKSLTFAGNYSVAPNGRTFVTFTTPETFHYVAYPVSSTRLIGISIETGDNYANMTSLDQ